MLNKKNVLAMILSACMLLSGCGNSNTPVETEATTVTTEPEKDLFAEEYKSIVEKIKNMNSSSEYVVGVIDEIWEEVGPEYVMTALGTILSCSSLEDFKNASVSTKCVIATAIYPSALNGVLISDGMEDDVYERVKLFNDNAKQIDQNRDDLNALIKELRNTYSEHSDEISRLHDYYVESEILADFALKPEGSLISYRSSFSEMKDNIRRTEKYADIY